MTAEAETKNKKRIQGGPSRLVAATLLTRVIDDKRNLDALCDGVNGLGSYLALEAKDQALARAIVVTALRFRNQIDAALRFGLDRKLPAKARFLLHGLHVAVAQLLFMDIPDRAAINIAVELIGADKRTIRFRKMANAVLRKIQRGHEAGQLPKNSRIMPDWLWKECRSDFGKLKAASMDQMIQYPSNLDISVKQHPQNWAAELEGELLPTGSVRLQTRQNVTTLPGFDAGEWWVQDAASALPAKLLSNISGKSVADLCAAPGGKTAQLISFGANVTAVEASAVRLARLAQNLDRLHMSATLIEADLLDWQPENQFDAVLLDAPCSSTGTIRRHPDVMWTKSMADVLSMVGLQKEMIKKAATLLKPGGRLVYSNCSLLKAEGEDLFAQLDLDQLGLKHDPVLPEEFPGMKGSINGQGNLRTFLHEPEMKPENRGGMDAFFACRFEKV